MALQNGPHRENGYLGLLSLAIQALSIEKRDLLPLKKIAKEQNSPPPQKKEEARNWQRSNWISCLLDWGLGLFWGEAERDKGACAESKQSFLVLRINNLLALRMYAFVKYIHPIWDFLNLFAVYLCHWLPAIRTSYESYWYTDISRVSQWTNNTKMWCLLHLFRKLSHLTWCAIVTR